MQPFTFDQSVIAGLLFLLGLLIGMYFLAGGKWKRRYRDEVLRREALETENEQLRRDSREMESLRNAAARSPATGTTHVEERTTTVRRDAPDDQNVRRDDGEPDVVIRRP